MHDRHPAVGPISQLLRFLHKYGATLTIDLVIEQDHEMPIHLLTDPWQTLKLKAADLAVQARGRELAQQRRCMGGLSEVDTMILHSAWRRHPLDTRPILDYIATGAAWTAGSLHEAGLAHTPQCPLCGAHETDIIAYVFI